MSEHRVVSHQNIDAIAKKLGEERMNFLNRVEIAVKNTIVFSQSAATAIGDISIGEATEGIIEFFRDEMRK